ncbi:MAG: dTDP-4-dehydrorhamnose reductase [Acidobacteriota bacterium]|jgi:dTDP-4-dehydrorhamnose reductase|nr:dTDP-4-dehydrorhamnose reductase [Acidobacteriota bacterium]
MRILILGGSGMLGHKLWQQFAPRFDTYATFRPAQFSSYERFGIFDKARSIGGVSAEDFESVERAFESAQPEVVVNCIGIVKQDAAAKDPLASISVNALFPHRLAALSRATGARLIHLSTDCVFSGRKGNYVEADTPDAEDLYGRTKLLGEVDYENCLTIRTSMIGRELSGAHGLIEWFLSQQGKTVRGYRRAIFSGFTTLALSEIIASVITDHPQLRGVWHVASEPINKFDLLTLVKEVANLNIRIEPDETFVCDRSLNDARFRQATGFAPPSWSDMILRLFQDTTP